MSTSNKSLLSIALQNRTGSAPVLRHEHSTPLPTRPVTSQPIPISRKERPPAPLTAANSPPDNLPILDKTSELSKVSVVKSRSGSVLSRGFILKTDYYPNGRALDLDINLGGAPNFRSPRGASFNVFGVAQPRLAGLKAILSLLNCRPGVPTSTHCVWFNTREEPVVYIGTRPFVLRDSADPKQNLQVADRAEILEAVEQRLKEDILKEAAAFGGLVLTHNEIEETDGMILPTWTAADQTTVKTSREVWEGVRADGWHVEYHRIPISQDRPIEDNYLDAYVSVLKKVDPLNTPVVFNCGVGAVRTTYAMIAACIVRRKQYLELGLHDHYTKEPRPHPSNHTSSTPPAPFQAAIALEQAEIQREHNESLLRLAYILQRSLDQKSQSAIQLLLTQPSLQKNLQTALLGNYSIILSLLGCVDNGLETKRLVDRIIDSCNHVLNLREAVLVNRINYSVASMDDQRRSNHMLQAAKALEKYYFIIAFASYVESSNNFEETFASWMEARIEISNQVMFLRRSGLTFKVFAPISDLKQISKIGLQGYEQQALDPMRKNNVTIAGGQVLGDEWAEHVVANRSGIILRASTLLKSDQWVFESEYTPHGVRGVTSFRNVPGTNIYACGQPTEDAIDEVVHRIHHDYPGAGDIVWITLREEPIVLINGAPYCLRRESFSLRNMKDYGGISASRLEVLEERLRDDVIAELRAFGGRVLLHTETADGHVIPVWEEAKESDVTVLKDVFESKKCIDGVTLHYSRVPITSERPPDFHDISDLMEVVIRTHSARYPIIVNCQLGKRRSTITATIVLLIQQWIQGNHGYRSPRTPPALERNRFTFTKIEQVAKPQPSYKVINNLLRVIRGGHDVKNAVDDAIEQCSQVFNLHKAIEEAKTAADEAVDERKRKRETQRGLHHLQQYFELVIFQAYLSSTPADTWRDLETFENFVKARPVFRTFEKELREDGINALKPLERVDVSDGVAMPDEVLTVVANRSGIILSASTILKSDFFSNLQKMSLPERIDGSPNFRRVPLNLGDRSPELHAMVGEYVCGSGMPTLNGLRAALKRIDAGPDGTNTVFWTSLREEPVIYVGGRPHVLRLVDRPLQNMEATGITTDVVEQMEKSLKKDTQREAIKGGGRVLLHDETEDSPGAFTITPQWETIAVEDIMTPRDVFELVAKEGYKVDYARVAITDEQAPLPETLALILDRVRQGLKQAGHLVFNCQMGRGRTTTGMVCAGLVASILYGNSNKWHLVDNDEGGTVTPFDPIDGVSEEEAYLNGEYKVILQLVGLLSHGKLAKRLADQTIDAMDGVQNLRRAIFDYKLKVEATDKAQSPSKYEKLMALGVNYLYRYGTLIVFANYLMEMREENNLMEGFVVWLEQRREIRAILRKRSLD